MAVCRPWTELKLALKDEPKGEASVKSHRTKHAACRNNVAESFLMRNIRPMGSGSAGHQIARSTGGRVIVHYLKNKHE